MNEHSAVVENERMRNQIEILNAQLDSGDTEMEKVKTQVYNKMELVVKAERAAQEAKAQIKNLKESVTIAEE